MKLHYFPGDGGITNFGDELNRWLWPKVAPEVLARSTETLFVGIGTLLNDGLPIRVPKVIFGSGVGYGSKPASVDDWWRIYFVRGPLSAAALGLPRSAGIADPAILLRLAFAGCATDARTDVAFVPHWENAHDGWLGLCQAAGVRYIDPRWDPERVLIELSRCRLVLAEAMHAAIAADALRVPWLPVETGQHVLRFKWEDWSRAMALDYRPIRWLSNWESTRGMSAKRWVKNALLVRQIRSAARSNGMLSDDAIFGQRLDACVAMLDKLRRDTVERNL